MGQIIAEDSDLGIERSDGVTIIEIVQQCRSEDQKSRLRELARGSWKHCEIRPDDLIVSVTSNGRQDCSFGLGRAQFLDGDLYVLADSVVRGPVWEDNGGRVAHDARTSARLNPDPPA